MYSFLYLFRLSPQFTPFAYLKELKIGWEISSPRVFSPFPLNHLAWLHSISPRTLQFEVLSLRLSRPCPFPLLPLAILQKSFGALFPPARRFSFFCFSSSGAVVQCTWWCSISLDGFPSTPSVRFSLCFPPRVFHIFFGMENLHQLLAIATFLMITTSSGCVLCVFTVAFVAFVQNAAVSVNFLEGKPK